MGYFVGHGVACHVRHGVGCCMGIGCHVGHGDVMRDTGWEVKP